MKADSLKLELLEWLTSLDDKEIIRSLFFYKYIQQHTDWWDELTKQQLADVKRGIKESKDNKTISNKEVWAKYGRKPAN